MSCSLSFHIPGACPSFSSSPNQCKNPSLTITCQLRQSHQDSNSTKQACKVIQDARSKLPGLAIQVGVLLASVAEPALAVTGVNDEVDWIWVLIQSAISAFIYFLAVPPIILNWLRTRWYRRNLLEMYLQFMCVFLFFPGVLLWAPFVNFRKFPRDPSMKYPWSEPEDPSKFKVTYRKYPYATPEDYE